ncbi:hypothetical protein SCHPADRAFT_131208 [Schizopora paradoxa]|uniref:Uncharacterized protein n=1 Tax=Schizopora paradoxa TaxID=27342 RepID=A0A0H2S1B8_9AGAM|nr:hypothetical protein SCHPADRAFT_131208 [Schizopora paradoxa]
MVFPADPEASRALIKALGAPHTSEVRQIIQGRDVFDCFFSVASKWRPSYPLTKELRNWDLKVGTLVSDASTDNPKFLADADPSVLAQRSSSSWRFAYQPGKRPDYKQNRYGTWERTGKYNFVENKNLHGETVRISNELKSGQDNIVRVSFDELKLRDALKYLFSSWNTIANMNDVELYDVGIITLVEVYSYAEFEVVSPEGQDTELYFHINSKHVQNGWNASPWGHLSGQARCVGKMGSCASSAEPERGSEIASIDHDCFHIDKVYRQEMHGVRMHLSQSCRGIIYNLSKNEAAVARWAHDILGDCNDVH